MDIAVIADDLTGANANGALLAAKGFSSVTLLDLADLCLEDVGRYSAVAHSTDSRLLSPHRAGERVRAAVEAFAACAPVLLAKRVDSTLRGNIGAETEAALTAMEEYCGREGAAPGEPPLAVVVPSFPSSGRIAVGGCMVVHGVPLERSPIARDAATPIRHSSVSAILAEQTAMPVGLVPLPLVLSGSEGVRREILRLRRAGHRIVVCDAVTDADITVIAESLRGICFPVLAVDPGPFTAELASVLLPGHGKQAGKKILAVVGSASDLTRRQLETLRHTHKTHIATLNCADVLDPALREKAMQEVVTFLLAAPDEARVVGVCTANRADDVFSLEAVAAARCITVGEASERVGSALAVIAGRLLEHEELHIGGLYTSGGEITVAVIRSVGGKGFCVEGEVLPLAAHGHMQQGRFSSLPMVTKGGFVGDDSGLVQCVNFLLSKL